MNARSHAPEAGPEHGPEAAPSADRPVRDSERLGDEKYEVTPPRAAVRAPEHDPKLGHTHCAECNAEIDPATAYRSDAEEYAYHFCAADCYQRWRTQATGGTHRRNIAD